MKIRFNGPGVGSPMRRLVAFTLLELLAVLSIIGMLASIVVPTMHALKPNPASVAAQQLLADIARARQSAISQRTTVFVVFLGPNFLGDFPTDGWPAEEQSKAQRIQDKQLVGYTFVSLRSLGDQPGQATRQYLSAWRTLPEGAYISAEKFMARNQSFIISTNEVFGFDRTNGVSFPSEETPAGAVTRPYPDLPYIAFNYLGQLTSGVNEYIPISQGSVMTTANGEAQIVESLPGNTTSLYNLVRIDWLTGRARLERQEVR